VTASKAAPSETSVFSFIYEEIYVCAAFSLAAALSALCLMLCFTAVFDNKTELQSFAASSTLGIIALAAGRVTSSDTVCGFPVSAMKKGTSNEAKKTQILITKSCYILY
jgi:hypothetical protein